MPAKDYFLPEFKPFLTSVPSTCLCLLLEEGTKSIPGTITLENTWLSCKNPAQRQSSQTTHIRHQRLGLMQLPSGKRLHNYGKSPFLMGKLTIFMAIFNSYVTLPEGITYTDLLQVFHHPIPRKTKRISPGSALVAVWPENGSILLVKVMFLHWLIESPRNCGNIYI